VAIKYR